MKNLIARKYNFKFYIRESMKTAELLKINSKNDDITEIISLYFKHNLDYLKACLIAQTKPEISAKIKSEATQIRFENFLIKKDFWSDKRHKC